MNVTYIKPKLNSAKIIRDIAENSWRTFNSAAVSSISAAINEKFSDSQTLACAVNQAVTGSVSVDVGRLSPIDLKQTVVVHSNARTRKKLLSVHSIDGARIEQIPALELFHSIYADQNVEAAIEISWEENEGEIADNFFSIESICQVTTKASKHK